MPAAPASLTGRSRKRARAFLFSSAFVALAAFVANRIELLDRTKARLSDAIYLDQVGVSRQLSLDDCGVAAMEMLIAHLTGRSERLDSLRQLTIARRRGISFAELSAFAETRGLRATGWQMSVEELRTHALPVIVQFPNHFLVLDSFSGAEEAILRDPSIGRIRMAVRDFERAWTGRVLFIGAGDTLSRSRP